MNTNTWHAYTILFYVNKNEIAVVRKSTELEIAMLTAKTVSEGHVLHVFSHMWQLVSEDVKVKRRPSVGDGESGRTP